MNGAGRHHLGSRSDLLGGQAKAEQLQQITARRAKAAAKRAAQKGLKPGVAGLAATWQSGRRGPGGAQLGLPAVAPLPGIEGPGGIPHYFGPYGNWAYSPLPKGPVAAVSIVDGGTGYNNPMVVIDDAYGTGASVSHTGDSVGWRRSGPVIVPGGRLALAFPLPSPPSWMIRLSAEDARAAAMRHGALADAVIGGTLTGGMRKFVDELPAPGARPAAQQPRASTSRSPFADTTARSARVSDYYEIALVEYTEKMHSDLPPTRLRGYVQIWTDGTVVPGARQLPLTNPDGSRHLEARWHPGLWRTTSPITWGPSSSQRGGHTA